MTIHRDYTKAIDREVSGHPGVSWRTEIGGRHARVVLRFGDRERFTVVPISPSDSRRGVKNMLGSLRKTLRELAALA